MDICWYDDENEIQWWKRCGRGEDAMVSGSCWGPHDIAFANVTIFAASLPRVYCACTTSMEMLRRLAHDLRDAWLTAFQVRSPNLGVCFEHAQNKRRDSAIIGDHWRPWRPQHDVWRFYHVYTTFIPRLWRSWGALDPFSVAVDTQ